MKLLLDENLPIKSKFRFLEKGWEVFTIYDLQWQSKKNGELLNLMIEHQFTHFLTFDSQIRFQQNFEKYPLCVIMIIAPYNNYTIILELFEDIIRAIQKSDIGPKVVNYQPKKT